ncbi:MAG: sigma-70 family RNA polymerase sigma factor [Vicinamibacteria bacterium]
MNAPSAAKPAGPFPETRHSVLVAARSPDPEERRQAFAALAEAYWKPAYKYARLRFGLSPADAEDLTQGFFAEALQKAYFERFDPARARFRTYLRTCLDGFAGKARASARAQKRGGGAVHLPLDFPAAERELRGQPGDASDPEAYFQREWMRALFEQALSRLQAQCAAAGREVAFQVFRAHDVDAEDAPPSYAALGERFGLPVTQVTNHLSAMRRDLRRHLLAGLRELCASDEEFRQEAQALLGAAP